MNSGSIKGLSVHDNFPARYTLQDLNNLNSKMLKLGLILLSCKRRGWTKLAKPSGIRQGYPLKWKECGQVSVDINIKRSVAFWRNFRNTEKGTLKNISLKLTSYNLLYMNNIITWMWFINLNHYFIPYLCSNWDPSGSLKSNLQMSITLGYLNTVMYCVLDLK